MMETKFVRLGDYIEKFRNKCGNTDAIVSGVDINKQFIPTRANLEGTDISGYYLVPPNYFACNLMHIGRDERLPIAFNLSDNNLVVTSAYYVFRIRESCKHTMLNEYLYIFLNCSEIDRLTWFYTDSSIRGNLSENRFLDIQIPLPPIEKQREIVNVWKSLRDLKEQNEKLVEPLMALCRSKVQELKNTMPLTALGPYIEPCDERNTDLRIQLSQGISNLKFFQDPKQVAENSKSDKIVRKGQFAYNRATTRNGEKISIAYREGPDCTVSSAYQIFKICDENKINPKYLMLWFNRPEFDRYARYKSKGSAHEFFEYDEMCRVGVPMPPIEIQQAIVNIYECAQRAKKIAEEADKQLKTICPALIQYVINNK